MSLRPADVTARTAASRPAADARPVVLVVDDEASYREALASVDRLE